jgi:HSP20 family protein
MLPIVATQTQESPMSIIKWQPFREMDDAFGRLLPVRWPRWMNEVEGGANFEWTPSADISETDNEYLIRAELPAVKKDDVKITIDQGMITISGERKDKKETKDEKFHRIESFQGQFTRSFTLPENVAEKDIRAETRDGVLTVHLPKSKVEKAKSIEVKVQ